MIVTAQQSETNHSPLRAASSRGFVMTKDDIDILGLVLDHRFLRRDHLSTLTGRHAKRLHRRLSRLEEHGYLTSIRLPQQKFIYGLGRCGVETLVGQGRAPEAMLDERLRTHELSELFLKHEMMIVDIHVRLSAAPKDGPVCLAGWREGIELHDTVVAVDARGSSKLPVRPDAFFTLLDSRRLEGANRANYALEADRSTTTQTRFQEKLRAYWAYIEQGRHEKRFGVKGFRVLTVTLTEARAKNLMALATTVVPEKARKYFLFTPLDRFMKSVEPTGERLCYSARTPEHELHALVPPPNQLHKENAVV
jgi:Replication-relaxation